MATCSGLRYLYLAHFSRPQGDRTIYRAIRKLKPARIVQIGIGDGLRSLRMIAVASRYHAGGQVRYTGIDLFEDRPRGAPAGLTLKATHRLLSRSSARVQLVPGDPLSALSRAANALQATDLVVISMGQDRESLERAWFYFPRMLRSTSVVLEETLDETTAQSSFRAIRREEVETRAQLHHHRRAA